MITPSFALTATERVLPKLALDFTTASLDSRITFTRTTGASNPATYVNSSGYVTAATNNQPRFDYNPITLACNGLLVEEQRQNSFTQSSNFSDAVWLKSAVSISSGAAISPDGTLNASKLVEDNTTNGHSISRGISVTNGIAYTFSCFAKKSERKYLRLVGATNFIGSVNFDLDDGSFTITAGSPIVSVFPFPNGWYRCAITVTTSSTSITPNISMATSSSGTGAYQGDGTSGIFIYGAQLEAGAFATSYIPTTSAALTRNADVATMTGTNFSDWFNASEGAFQIQTAFVGTAASRSVFYADDNTTSNYIGINTTGSSLGRGSIVTSGAAQASVSSGTAISAGNTVKVTLSYKLNNVYVASNGATANQDTSVTLPTINQLQFATFTGGAVSSQWLAKLNYYPQWFTAAETQAFSK